MSNIITIIVQRERKAWRKCLAGALIQIPAGTSDGQMLIRSDGRWWGLRQPGGPAPLKACVGAPAHCAAPLARPLVPQEKPETQIFLRH